MELNRVVVGAGGNAMKNTPQGSKNDVLTQNDDGSVSFKANTSGSLQAYNAEGGTVAPPSSGRVRWDNATQASATKLFISTINANGGDLTNFFSNISVNDALYIQSQGDSNKYQYWGINAINNQPTYSECDVVLIESLGGDFSTTGQGENLIFRRERGGLSTYNYQQGISGIESSPTLTNPAFNDYTFIYDQSTGELKTTDFNRINSLLNGDTAIIVTDPSHFGTIDSTKIYIIGGIVDMGTTSIEVPAGGINIIGYTFDVSQLISSEDNYTMFTSPVGGSGNVLRENIGITTSGLNSQVQGLTDATGFSAIEDNKVNYNNCTSLGYIDGYRQGLENGTGRFGGTPELELRGTWVGGYRTDTTITRAISDITALYKAGAGFNYNGRVKIGMNCDLPTNGALIDFAPSNINNDESLELSDCRVTRNGVINTADTTIYPNIDHTSVKSIWNDNVGVPNTTKYIRSNVTTEVTTTISASNTYYPLEGTFTVQENSHFDMPSNGEFRLLSGNGTYQILGDLVIDGGPNDVLDVRVTKSTDGGVTWPNEIFHIRRQVNSFVGGRDVSFFPVNFLATLVKDDRLRIEVENITDTSDVTAELDSYFIITGV